MVWLVPQAAVISQMQKHNSTSYEAFAHMDNLFACDLEKDEFLKQTVRILKGGHVFSDEDMKDKHLSSVLRSIRRALQCRISFAFFQKKEFLKALGSIETTERDTVLDQANQEIEHCIAFYKLFERQFDDKFKILIQMLEDVKEQNEEEIDDVSIASAAGTECE